MTIVGWDIVVLAKGKYRVTVKRKRWWTRKLKVVVYEGRGTVWHQLEPWGGRCSTSMEWWLTNVAVKFMSDAREANHAAR